jgi:hypothetical protein
VVIEPQQVQRAVHDQMSQVMRHTAARRGSLSADDAKRQHQFRRRIFVSQDVGGCIASAVARIQFADQTVVREHDTRARGRREAGHTCRPGNERDNVWHKLAPGWVHDDDPELRFGLLVRGGPPTVRFHYPCRGTCPVTVFSSELCRNSELKSSPISDTGRLCQKTVSVSAAAADVRTATSFI